MNFSSIQFFENHFVENIKEIIDEFQLNPNFLIIEITESILMEKSDKAISNIKRLQSFGMQVAIDDFGTGFSSLSYLNNFNIDIIKIDSSFIKNIYKNETNTIITRYIINMARELRIKIVAEGIENWDQLSFLRELNCNAGQGYIYSKPVPQHEIEKILAKKICKPVVASNTAISYGKNRRRFFRIKFPQLLESNLTILEINGKKINVGNTKVLVKDIGPGGLCFISNIKLPVERGIILQFVTHLLGKEIKVYGSIVRAEEVDNGLNEYGVEFTVDEHEREGLIRILNQVQIKMKNNIMFAEGSFITCSPKVYYKILDN